MCSSPLKLRSGQQQSQCGAPVRGPANAVRRLRRQQPAQRPIRQYGGIHGARHLAGKHADRVAEVEMADDAVLRDFDTTDALKKAPGFGGVR